MIINKAALDKIIQDMRITNLTKDKYENILDMFSSEPDTVHEWTEQDIHEYIRKMIQK